jgi:hypothetical protein
MGMGPTTFNGAELELNPGAEVVTVVSPTAKKV